MGFANPALLGLLGLVSLPIIIHLLNRRRFQIVRWAAMEFLLEAQRQNRRRVRLEHLLVLLLRCLAIALLALAVARPVSTSAGLALLPGVTDPVERVIVLDDSGSMEHRVGRTTSFERAREAIRGLVEDLRAERRGDLITLVRASRPDVPELLLTPPGNERVDTALAGLEQRGPTSLTFDVPGVLERALGRGGGEAEGPNRRVVYVVTDLRRRDWVGEAGELPRRISAAVDAARGERDPSELQLVLVDVGEAAPQNLGIVGLRPTEKLAMVGVPLELEVRVHNDGQQPVFDVPLQLETPGGRVPLTPIARIDAGEEAVVDQRTTFVTAGPQAVSVRLNEDALPLDDARHLGLRLVDQLAVLLVAGQDGAGPLDGAADLLRFALAPPGDVVSGVRPTVIGPEALAQEDLAGYGSIVLCNLDRWPEERRADLERFVARGGGLAVFLGDRVDVEAYDQVLYRGGAGLLPCKLGQRLEAEGPDQAAAVAPPSGDHPLTRVFAGDDNPFLKRVRARVRRELIVDRERDATSEVVLRFADPAGIPFVVEKPFARGRVMLFNTTADLGWSGWPRDPSFPITAQEMVRVLAPSAAVGRNLTCGEPLEFPLDPAQVWPEAKLRVPGEERPRELHAEPRPGSDALWVSYAETQRAGLYTLELTTQQGEKQLEHLAVDPDPSEGLLARADPAQLQAAGLALSVVRPSESTRLLAASDGTKRELWRSCIYLLALALLLEQVLAWRAAHHRRPELGDALSGAAAPTGAA